MESPDVLEGGGVQTDGQDALDADLAEFIKLDRKGPWLLAYLIARRVEPDLNHGVGAEQRSAKRFVRNVFRRISASEFARRTDTTPKRVLAYWNAWKRLADEGHVPYALDLHPDSDVEVPDEEKFPFFGEGGYYNSVDAAHISSERREAITLAATQAGARPTAAAYIVTHPSAVKAAVMADETARAAARAALKEFDARQASADRQDYAAAAAVTKARTVEHDRAAKTAARVDDVQQDVSIAVFNALADARAGVLAALAALQKQPDGLSAAGVEAAAELCDTIEAVSRAIRDLATGTALDDAALAAFLEESEKLL